MASIVSLLIALVLSISITRIATIALTHTGLSRQAAAFQARSAFTGVGYTTRESEKIVNHPVRRKVLLLLMLLGNAGVITVVSSLVITFVGVDSGTGALQRIIVLAAGIGTLWMVATSSWLNRKFELVVRRLLDRFTDVRAYDYESLLHLAGEYSVSELKIEPDDWLTGRSLMEADLRSEGILVLGISRATGAYLGAPAGDSVIRADDLLLLYGRTSAIERLDRRRAGKYGDVEHEELVAEQTLVEEEEQSKDAEADESA